MLVSAVLHLCAAYVHCVEVSNDKLTSSAPVRKTVRRRFQRRNLTQALASRKCEAAAQGAMIAETRSNPMPARRPGTDIQFLFHAASPVRA